MAGNNKRAKIFGSLIPPMVFIIVAGCSIGEPSNPFTGSSGWIPNPPQSAECSTALGVLNWAAGLSILGGIILMVITQGRIWRPIAIGIALVILSYAIAVFTKLVLLPIGIMLTLVCSVWAYKIILKTWRKKL